MDDVTTKLAGIGSRWGIEPAVLNRCSDNGIQLYFALVFILWVHYEISLPPMACCCLWLGQELYGHQRIGHPILIEIRLVPIVHGNENPFWHVLVCIFDKKGVPENVRQLILVVVSQHACTPVQ